MPSQIFSLIFNFQYMCLTGMELDGFYACFPAFPKDEFEKIYNEVKNQPEDGAEDNVISVNCS